MRNEQGSNKTLKWHKPWKSWLVHDRILKNCLLIYIYIIPRSPVVTREEIHLPSGFTSYPGCQSPPCGKVPTETPEVQSTEQVVAGLERIIHGEKQAFQIKKTWWGMIPMCTSCTSPLFILLQNLLQKCYKNFFNLQASHQQEHTNRTLFDPRCHLMLGSARAVQVANP